MSEPTPQPQTPTAPPPPGTPAPTATNTPAPAEGGVISQVPRNRAEVRALEAQRSELSRQLTSAAERREELVSDLEGASGANRAGIEARIKLLDERILQLEADIASTGKLLTSARGSTTLGDAPPPLPGGGGFNSVDAVPIVAILSVFVFFPLAVAYARNMWKRGSVSKHESQLERENADRLSRLESAIDTIAIEMERVSEGQRFVTKLLAESQSRDKVRIESRQ